MAEAIHSMIRILDEARAIDFYCTALGMKVVERKDHDSFTLLYLRSEDGPFELELTVNKGRTSPMNWVTPTAISPWPLRISRQSIGALSRRVSSPPT